MFPYDDTIRVSSQPISVEQLLARYLDEDGAEDADGVLTSLIVEHAEPAIRIVVRRRVPNASPEDREDLEAGAIAALIGRLTAMRADPRAAPAIDDFQAYAAGVAANTIHAHFAARFPARSRLRRRIRLALTTDARLLIEESKQGLWICGRARDTGRTPVSAAQMEACREELGRRRLPGRLADFLDELFGVLGGPAELNELTALAGNLLGIHGSDVSAGQIAEFTPDLMATPDKQAETRSWLERLWKEILDLSSAHRVALLLGLRTPQESGLVLIGNLGIARFRVLAEAVGMTREELREIWNRLPLDDNEIARRLGLERQQVINLRSSARRRLERRMGAR